MNYITDQTFEYKNFLIDKLDKATYENCTFISCDFSTKNLSEFVFSECTFLESNLSNCKILETAFRTVSFKNSKLLGLRWDQCRTLGLQFTFENCQLNHSVFYQLKIPKTKFTNCNLSDIDFAETNLSACQFDNCDFQNAIFEDTNLEYADLSSAVNFNINPTQNRIKKAKFSMQNVKGLLKNFEIILVDNE